MDIKEDAVRRNRLQVLAGIALAASVLGACVSTGVDTVEDFKQSVESDAPCKELFDQRTNFEAASDLEKIDAELERIGCENADSERNDQ